MRACPEHIGTNFPTKWDAGPMTTGHRVLYNVSMERLLAHGVAGYELRVRQVTATHNCPHRVREFGCG